MRSPPYFTFVLFNIQFRMLTNENRINLRVCNIFHRRKENQEIVKKKSKDVNFNNMTISNYLSVKIMKQFNKNK